MLIVLMGYNKRNTTTIKGISQSQEQLSTSPHGILIDYSEITQEMLSQISTINGELDDELDDH